MKNKELIKFEDLWVGLHVKDGDGLVGKIKNCEDIHNIIVDFGGDIVGLYCLVPNCIQEETDHYDPLYYLY
jgi:hypothetical protein